MQNSMNRINNPIDLYSNLFDVHKIKVNPKRKTWELYIKPKKLIDVNELKLIEDKLAKEYAISELKLVLINENDLFGTGFSIEECKDDIIARVLNQNPGFIGFLKDCSIEINDNNVMKVTVKSQLSYDYVKQRKLDLLIEKIALSDFGISISVEFNYYEEDTDSDDYIDTLLEEEKHNFRNTKICE